MTERQPRMIPNPMWCDRCDGRGYLVADVEWKPYTVQCPECAGRRAAQSVAHGESAPDPMEYTSVPPRNVKSIKARVVDKGRAEPLPMPDDDADT